MALTINHAYTAVGTDAGNGEVNKAAAWDLVISGQPPSGMSANPPYLGGPGGLGTRSRNRKPFQGF